MSTPAILCESCGQGTKADECVLCRKRADGQGIPAQLCPNCGFSNQKLDCVRCSRRPSSRSHPAVLCRTCVSARKNDCAKCGKRI